RVREVWFSETGFAACPMHWRDDLTSGESLSGPAIVEAMDSTIVVPSRWVATIDANGYIRLRRR
ncbi:MAG TPA: hypothetical protein VFQ90_17880, partial [Stellaceae bacterium]|nr:hypothetical protein [Stellaceae bacterium]